jgi:hypothetical protein
MVISEVGSKSQHVPVVPGKWVAEACDDLHAGATYIVAEGRESGTVGLYEADGSIREHVVDALLAAVPSERWIFEAPRSVQQAWFIRQLGPGVNLGNVAATDIIALETLRLGLRADTADIAVGTSRDRPGGTLVHGRLPVPTSVEAATGRRLETPGRSSHLANRRSVTRKAAVVQRDEPSEIRAAGT